MERFLKIFRGDSLLGYAGLDDAAGPCRPFEPAEAFFPIEALFQREHALSLQLADCTSDEEEVALIEAGDLIMEEILAPGVRMETMNGSDGFKCIQLTIADGRVCWR